MPQSPADHPRNLTSNSPAANPPAFGWKANRPSELPVLPPRDPAGHKGTFGTVAVVGGCAAGGSRMSGAPALVARAAFRAGCGRVVAMVPEPLAAEVLTACPSATSRPVAVLADGQMVTTDLADALDVAWEQAMTLAVGPGLGTGDSAQHATLLAVQQHQCNLVLDADGINCLAQLPDVQDTLVAAAILTPHVGEFTTLCRALQLGWGAERPLESDQARLDAATELAQRLGCIVVLKGQRTVVTDGLRSFVNPSGNAALAVGGSGDVLTGVIAGLTAQFVPPPRPSRPWPMPPLPPEPGKPWTLFDAACFGVWAHGAAAERWCAVNHARAGMLAHELADSMPQVLVP